MKHHTLAPRHNMIYIKPSVQYDELFTYLEHDLRQLRKLKSIDFSHQFYELRSHLFGVNGSLSLKKFVEDQDSSMLNESSLMSALFGQTLKMKSINPKCSDYWHFLEEWTYIVCSTEMMTGKLFVDFTQIFLKYYMDYYQCKSSQQLNTTRIGAEYTLDAADLGQPSLEWDVNFLTLQQ